jgi:TetR/AcrR family transcriptional repressor of nem operon
LIYLKGAERVSLDEVIEATGVSKSQLYHYFDNKDDLVREVIDLQTRRILEAHAPHLQRLDSFAALREWRDATISMNRTRGGVGGWPRTRPLRRGDLRPPPRPRFSTRYRV